MAGGASNAAAPSRPRRDTMNSRMTCLPDDRLHRMAGGVKQPFIVWPPEQRYTCASSVTRRRIGAKPRTARQQRQIGTDAHSVLHHRAEPGAQFHFSFD